MEKDQIKIKGQNIRSMQELENDEQKKRIGMDIVTGSILAKSCIDDIFDQYYESQDNLVN